MAQPGQVPTTVFAPRGHDGRSTRSWRRARPRTKCRAVHVQPLLDSAVDHALIGFGVTGAVRLRERLLDLARSSGSARLSTAAMFSSQAVELRRAGDRDDPWLLREQPGERDLRGRCVLALRDLLQQVDEDLFAWRASGAKRGTMLRKSPLVELVVSSTFPVRNPLPSGLNGTKPMPSSSSVGRISVLRLAQPERVLALERGRPAARRAPGECSARRPRRGRSA